MGVPRLQHRTVLSSDRMTKTKDASDAVRNLKVDKSAFDAALKKLIATPPIRKADIPKAKPWGHATRAAKPDAER